MGRICIRLLRVVLPNERMSDSSTLKKATGEYNLISKYPSKNVMGISFIKYLKNYLF